MDSIQLSQILKADRYTAASFGGVLASNQLPRKPLRSFPAAFVANVDPSTQPGRHWVAFFFLDGKHAEYFDSYGCPPGLTSFKTFLKKNSLYWQYNAQRIQGPLSTVCGQYVLYYLLHRCRGWTLTNILEQFTDDLSFNDFLVNDFIEKWTGFEFDVHDVDFLHAQFP